MKTYVLSFLVFIFLFLSCQKDKFRLPSEQIVIFEVAYSNWAWGYQHKGFFITVDGERLAYETSPDYRPLDENNEISTADLVFNLSLADSTLSEINVSKIERKAADISEAATGEVTSEEGTSADFGGVTAYAYQQIDSNTYQRIILGGCGDRNLVNSNKKAKKLADWLLDIWESPRCF